MKRRSGEIQVFSMSFLDVLSCALGGTLLLLLLVQESQQQQNEAQEEALQQMQQRIENSRKELDDAQKELQQAQKDMQDAIQKAKTVKQRLAIIKKANAKLKKAQTALTGLGGPLTNVVFIFDTSGSMSDDFGTSKYNPRNPRRGPRFNRYLGALKKGVKNYPITRFNVIRFSSDVKVWKPGTVVDATRSNRANADSFIDGFKPYGGTSTLRALQAAMKLPDIDTIILYSDGVPSVPGKIRPTESDVDNRIREINDWVKANHGKIVINTVAIGGSYKSKHREFLRKLAEITGGTSQAIF